MAERTPEIEVAGGRSVKGNERRLTLMPGLPGDVALTIYVKDKPTTVVVSVAELRAAIERIGR